MTGAHTERTNETFATLTHALVGHYDFVELLQASLGAEGRDGHRHLPEGVGGAAVGHVAVGLRLDRRQAVGELVEGGGDLGVGHVMQDNAARVWPHLWAGIPLAGCRLPPGSA